MEDGSVQVNRVSCGDGVEADIANVTTRHQLVYNGEAHTRVDGDTGVSYSSKSVKIDLVSLAEFGRCKFAFSGPTSKGMPSTSAVVQRGRLFGKTKVSIYEGGTVVQTGYLSPEQALASAHDLAREMNRKLNTQLRVLNFSVINIVAIVKTGRSVNCTALKRMIGAACTYDDPKTVKRLYGKKGYSGAIIASTMVCADRTRNPMMVVFPTGIAVLMGCQKRSEIAELAREFLGYIDTLDTLLNNTQLVVAAKPDPTAALTGFELYSAAKDILKMYGD